MKTSYFANLKNISNPISISAKTPDWYNGKKYKALAPTYNILMAYKNREIDSDDYTRLYTEYVLGKLNVEDTYNELLSFGDNITLLCYERPEEFCHRRIVASWFERSLNVKVPELTLKKPKLTLFNI